MKTIMALKAKTPESCGDLQAWALNEYAPLCAGMAAVEKLIVNLVQAPPDFMPRPPPDLHAPQPYDVLITFWIRGDVKPSHRAMLEAHAGRIDLFQVEEIVERNELPEVSATVTPGIKNIPFVVYKPELSTLEGNRKWDAHAQLGLRTHTGMKRYVRNFVTGRSDGAPHIDGIAEVSFATLEWLRTGLFPTPQDRAEFIADVAGFVQGNITHYSTEHVVKW